MQVLTKKHFREHKKIRLRAITRISKPKQNILCPSRRAMADIHDINNEIGGLDHCMHKALQVQNVDKI